MTYLINDLVAYASFKKRQLKHCDPLKDKYGKFPTLKSAQSACISDTNCNAVYDEHCDSEGEFYLCPTTASLQSSQHSCVYEKRKYIISQLTNVSNISYSLYHLLAVSICLIRR